MRSKNMLDIKKHRTILFNLITEIYRSEAGNYLGFKGGTMAHFFYGLDRFSVDLDFDLLDVKKIDRVSEILPKILLKFGSMKEQTIKRFTLFYLLSYEKGQRNIKIEISKRGSAGSRYEISNFYGTDVKRLVIEDAFSTKLLACTTRSKIAFRDFYDVYFYLKKGIVPNEKIILDTTKKNLTIYLNYLMRFIKKNVTNRNILQGVGELVDEKQKTWIRNNLKKELVNRLKFLADQVK